MEWSGLGCSGVPVQCGVVQCGALLVVSVGPEAVRGECRSCNVHMVQSCGTTAAAATLVWRPVHTLSHGIVHFNQTLPFCSPGCHHIL